MPRGLFQNFLLSSTDQLESTSTNEPASASTSAAWPQGPSLRRGRLRTAFGDMQPYWQGGSGVPDDDAPEDEEATVEIPKRHGKEWLGPLEDSEVLAKTDLYEKGWIGTHQEPGKKLRAGEHPKCEPFMTFKNFPWWHPSFTFKVPVHAVRIRLTDISGPVKHKKWDVIFAGEPGGIFGITNTHVPVGGELPQFEPFCEPLKAKTKLELRFTEAENEEWDEKLTLVPPGQGRFRNPSPKPRMPLTQRVMENGAVGMRPEKDDEVQEGPKDVLGNVNYMSMPPMLVAGALGGFL